MATETTYTIPPVTRDELIKIQNSIETDSVRIHESTSKLINKIDKAWINKTKTSKE